MPEDAQPEDSSTDIRQPVQPHLAKQDATTVDPAKLTALTPEVVCECVRRFAYNVE